MVLMLEAQVPHHVSWSPNPKVCSGCSLHMQDHSATLPTQASYLWFGAVFQQHFSSAGLDLVGKLSFSLPLLGRCYSCCKALCFMKESLVLTQTLTSNSLYLQGEYVKCSPHSWDSLRSNLPLHRDCICFKDGFAVLDRLIMHYLNNLTFSYSCLGSFSTIPNPLSILIRIHWWILV